MCQSGIDGITPRNWSSKQGEFGQGELSLHLIILFIFNEENIFI